MFVCMVRYYNMYWWTDKMYGLKGEFTTSRFRVNCRFSTYLVSISSGGEQQQHGATTQQQSAEPAAALWPWLTDCLHRICYIAQSSVIQWHQPSVSGSSSQCRVPSSEDGQPDGVHGGGGLPHLHPQHLQAGHVQSVSEQDPVTLRGHGHPGISQ